MASLFSSVGQSFAGLRLLSRAAPNHRSWVSCLQDVRVCCLAVPPPQTNAIAHRLWGGFVQYGSLQRRLSGMGVSLCGPPPTSQRTLSNGRRSFFLQRKAFQYFPTTYATVIGSTRPKALTRRNEKEGSNQSMSISSRVALRVYRESSLGPLFLRRGYLQSGNSGVPTCPREVSLLCRSCSSPRSAVAGFLQTPPHGDVLALDS
jgi:hypothetical protein